MKIKCPKCKYEFKIKTLADSLYDLWDNKEDECWDNDKVKGKGK